MTEQSPKAVNLLRIYNRLRQSPVTLDVLFQWTERIGIKISRRSLYRYLNDLENTVQFQGERLIVYEGEKNKKVWKIEYDKSSATLNQFDINTYYFIRNFLPRSLNDPRQISIEKFDKIFYESLSKSKFQANVDAHNGSFIRTDYIDAIYSDRDHILLEDFIWAIQNRRKIRADTENFDPKYFPRGFDKNEVLCPLKLVYHFGLIYICTYWETGKKIVIIPYNKLVESSITGIEFNPASFLQPLQVYLAEHFGITENYDNNIYDIQLEFAGYTGDYITTIHWHASQRFEKLENGNTMVHLRCGINRELIGFILYFINNVRVVTPMILKEILLERIDLIRDNYLKENLNYNSTIVSIDKTQPNL